MHAFRPWLGPIAAGLMAVAGPAALRGDPFPTHFTEEGSARSAKAVAAPITRVLLEASPGRSADLVVYGSTPGGLACAVRAAREGLRVLLVTHVQHVGGIFSNGLSTMDTLYNGARAPLYDELRKDIYDDYRTRYGEDSDQFRHTLPGSAKTKFEAHEVEGLFEEMLRQEAGITVVRGFYPVSARRELRALKSVEFRAMEGAGRFEASAPIFADCSYEGDLLAVAKVPYRFGREAREEFGEEHAGRIFMRDLPWPPAQIDPEYLRDYWKLNLIHYKRWEDQIIRLPSTGAADLSVQAYNLRTIVTCDPADRVAVEQPAGYNREELLRRIGRDINWNSHPPSVDQPNRKTYLNLPEVIGVQNAYVEGDWAARRRVTDEHRRLTLSLIYFMQHDPSVPEATRARWLEWGLPRDEFPENGHMPYEIYVRETRRLKGRATLTENDARLAPHLKRAPVHADSITATDWFLDSHACTPEHSGHSLWEGEMLPNNVTFPGQISYRTMLAEELDNLLVPVCASSTHIGWGVVRLEPTWMSMGEAAAYAAVTALRQSKTPAAIDVDQLVRLLAKRRVLLSFFNDIEGKEGQPWYPAVEYFGTQGFFGSYDARPAAALAAPLAAAWATAAAEWASGTEIDPTERARAMLRADSLDGKSVTGRDFVEQLKRASGGAASPRLGARLLQELSLEPAAPLTRGAACQIMFAAWDKDGIVTGPAAAAAVGSEFIPDNGTPAAIQAASIAQAADGALVVAWAARTPAGEGAPLGIQIVRREKGGWQPPIKVAGSDRNGVWNPVLFQPRKGPLMLFYHTGPSRQGGWSAWRTSADGGKTWTDAQRLPGGVGGPTKNPPVELVGGTILCPASDEHGGLSFEATGDFGKTWTRAVPALDGAEQGSDPCLLFEGGQTLQALGPTRSGYVLTTWSRDAGRTWSAPQLTDLPNSGSDLDAVTLADGRQLLVYNDTPGGRTPLTVAISDRGYSWRNVVELEAETGEFADPAIIQTGDGLVHLVYTWNGRRIRHVVLDPAGL